MPNLLTLDKADPKAAELLTSLKDGGFIELKVSGATTDDKAGTISFTVDDFVESSGDEIGGDEEEDTGEEDMMGEGEMMDKKGGMMGEKEMKPPKGKPALMMIIGHGKE